MGAEERLPPFIVRVPSIVGTVVKVREPVLMVRLLNVIADEPFSIPAPA